MSQPTSPSLFRTLTGGPERDIQVFWFSHAGGGTASLVRAASALPPTVSFQAARLPGREERINEVPYKDLDTLVDALARELSERAQSPFALLGHSFGALLAFLLAGRLAAQGKPPQLLQVMAALPPHSASEARPIAEMSDVELAEHLDRDVGGIPAALLGNPEALQYFLPSVRADLEMMQAFQFKPEKPLGLPVVAVTGTEDRVVTPEKMLGWKRYTANRFSLRSIPGDHFFPVASLPVVVRIASDYLKVDLTGRNR